MDLVSPVLFRRAEDEPAHPFLGGYRAAARDLPAGLDDAGGFDADARRRLGLYRLHLYLLMTVEMPSRGITRAEQPVRYERLAHLLDHELASD
ncbi:hypothetical protein [Plantactinospora sp. GCM10030261]|uniref:hypothetical protein n=1 Tax=Plantactinospora sp. GCM10030261 TaxID=3273420 RepID=UPI0036140DA3